MGKLKSLLKAELVSHRVRKKPDPGIWIFSSTDNAHYNYNSRYLFEYVKDNLPEITPYFVINDEKLRKKHGDKYGEQYFIETCSIEGMKKALSAGVWFTSAGLPVYGTGLGKNRTIVNLWHGIPLKKIALMDPNLSRLARIYFKKIFTENYTFVLTCSSRLIPVMAESFQISPDKIKVWGQPRNDVLFTKTDKEKVLGSMYPDLPSCKKAILYAPTFRDYGVTSLFPFKDYDKMALDAFLEKEDAVIFLRTHISEQGNAGPYLSDRVRYLGNEQAEDIMDIADMFDILITDYSSIYIDYLLLDRPLIFLPYDKEQYLKGRGMNFEYDKVTPGAKPDSQQKFIDAIAEICHGRDRYQQERQKCNLFFNEIQQPCMKNICDEVKKHVGMD